MKGLIWAAFLSYFWSVDPKNAYGGYSFSTFKMAFSLYMYRLFSLYMFCLIYALEQVCIVHVK